MVFPALVTKGEGDNPQQTPSVMNVKAAFFRQSRMQHSFFSSTDQYAAVSMNSASVLQVILYIVILFWPF